MIDDSDVDEAFTASLISAGWVSVILLVLALVLWAFAAWNEDDCAGRPCPHGKAKLLDHQCLCVEAAPAGER